MGGILQMGRSSCTATTAALLVAILMMTTTLFTTTHCAENNYTSWCNGRVDSSCLLIGDVDLDSEFMMDSEISRRTLASIDLAKTSQNKDKPVSCNRQKNPDCNPPKNQTPLPPNCGTDNFNRECYKH